MFRYIPPLQDEANQEIRDKALELAKICEEQGRGVLIVPMSHVDSLEANAGRKTFLACTLSPIEFVCAIKSAIDNYKSVLPKEMQPELRKCLSGLKESL